MCDLIGIAALLKAVAWPIAVLILTFFIVGNFKHSLSDFIRRIVKAEASTSGVKTELQANIQAVPSEASQPKIEDGKLKQTSPLNDIYMPDYLDLKKTIERDFSDDASMQKEAAMRLYAIAATERKFERIHRMIFGSQLNAVVRANMLGGRISLSDLKDIFLATAQQHPKAYEEFGFDPWLKFILDVGLLVKTTAVSSVDYYERTEFAKAYMHYIISLQLPSRDL